MLVLVGSIASLVLTASDLANSQTIIITRCAVALQYFSILLQQENSER